MHAALWVAKTGLSAQNHSLTSISNNLANVSTTGFKKDRAVFQDLVYQIQRQPGALSSQDTRLPSGLQLGTGVKVAGTQKIHTTGTLQETSQPLDMAVNGRGFFQIAMPDGTAAYTRDGTFQMDADGQLVTAIGYLLEPNITVPDQTNTLTISRDGIVSATQFGETTPTEIGQIDLVDFVNPTGLQAMGGNLFLETASSGAPNVGVASEVGFGSIEQGMLENSNVEVVEEMVQMITVQRAYEMNSKVISSADQMLQYLAQNT
ncbi:MAG: flagellar basal-body rod protein FlgG [Bermanella sp.]|jgi:flagellar basal-body rod protein FlgG